MATIITVQGQHVARYPAERATVNLTVAFDGPERETVVSSATSTAETITTQLASLLDASAGPVVTWASDRARVWADRPWNSEGKQLDVVHHAHLGITVTFSDFDALGAFVSTASATPGVQLSNIEWDVTRSTRTSALAEVRSRAVADAADKARVYAQAVGRASVSAVAIADPGMLGGGGSSDGAPRMEMMMARSAKMSDAVGAQFDFTPAEIEIAASVDARFEAS